MIALGARGRKTGDALFDFVPNASEDSQFLFVVASRLGRLVKRPVLLKPGARKVRACLMGLSQTVKRRGHFRHDGRFRSAQRESNTASFPAAADVQAAQLNCCPRRSNTAGQASTRASFKNYQRVGAILYESLLTA